MRNSETCVMCGKEIAEGGHICRECGGDFLTAMSSPAVAERFTELRDELEKYKTVAFYLVRLHRVLPEGRKLRKSVREIDEMSASTVKHMAENLDESVLLDYRRATIKVLNNK